MTSPEEGLEGWGHELKDTSSTEEPEETSGNLFPRACGRRASPDTPGFGPSSTDWWTLAFKQREDKFLMFMSLHFSLLVTAATWNVYLILSSLENYSEFHTTLSQICSVRVFFFSGKSTYQSVAKNPTPWCYLSLPESSCLQLLPVVCTTVFTSEIW